jgi:alpha-glucosidase
VVAFRVFQPGGSAVVVLANLGTTPVPLPHGATVLLASADLPGDGTLPSDATVWLEG